ncbi:MULTISPECIES: hypothetical protein [Kitasatospora]|uniref:Uncharacterized protein n=1 Tax=Kitasatospora setae (strain ATCC 33774 / DSM 43861 / JCM 3304 / KCC A-0304 / NBRC 14216 / KM-6054) TaxID=452652 RepID=E4NEW7_KITSK|nr:MULTISPECIES: hypothetical protein [Kitasatospora]BAJ29903.1 hypothetical protein KSE_41150 [Kitasatospora setae KM-6054]
MGIRQVGEGAGRRAGAALGAVTGAVASARAKAGSDWARRALETHPKPEVPLTAEWEVSLAGLVGRLPHVPGPAVRLLHMLDGLGQVAVGPDEVGFDGESAPWGKVLEIRCHSTLDLLPDVVVDREVDRIREFLPPVPGRKWLVTRAAEALLTVAMAATAAAERQERSLPCEIVAKNLIGRPKNLAGGLFAASALTLIPEAGEAILATARARGIPITVVEDPMTGLHAERAVRLRATTDRLTDALRRLRASEPEPELAPGEGDGDAGGSAGGIGPEPTKAEVGAAALAELEQLHAQRQPRD